MSEQNSDFIELKCPSCGGVLQIMADAAEFTCMYCGAKYMKREQAQTPQGPLGIVDQTTGRTLLHSCVPGNWKLNTAKLDTAFTSEGWPFTIAAEVTDGKGVFIRYRSNEAHTQKNGAAQAAERTYGAAFASNVNDRDFPMPGPWADREAAAQLGEFAKTLRFVGEYPLPLRPEKNIPVEQREQRLRAEAEAENRRAAAGTVAVPQVTGVFSQPIARVYEFEINGHKLRMGIHTVLNGSKTVLNAPGAGMLGMGAGLLGGLIGGLFNGQQQTQQPLGTGAPGGPAGQGQPMRFDPMTGKPLNRGTQERPMRFDPMTGKPLSEEAQAQAAAEAKARKEAAQRAAAQQAAAQKDARAREFAQLGGMGMQYLNWNTEPVFTLIAPAERFDEVYRGVFTDICSQTTIDPYWLQYREQTNMAEAQRTQALAGQQIQQMNANFQAMQRANAQRQAAFDAQNRAWQERSNAQFEANRARSQAAFDRSTPDYSEAIRGVNTYVDRYGHEHEVTVQADRAWTNASGDVIGGSNSFEPGGDWTEMTRK